MTLGGQIDPGGGCTHGGCSAVLAARIKNSWASMVPHTAAAVSCMYTHDHRLSDVVFTVAHTVVKWCEKEKDDDGHVFNIVPTTSGVEQRF